MLISGTMMLFVLICVGAIVVLAGLPFVFQLVAWLLAIPGRILALPGRAIRRLSDVILEWQVRRATVRALQARAAEAEERLRNEQIRDLFGKK